MRHGRVPERSPFLLNEGPTYPNCMIRGGMMAVPSAGKRRRCHCPSRMPSGWQRGLADVRGRVCPQASGRRGWRAAGLDGAAAAAGAYQGSGQATLTYPRPGLDYHVPRIVGLAKSSIRSIGHDLARVSGPGQAHVPARIDRNTWLIARRIGSACGHAIRLRGGCHGR